MPKLPKRHAVIKGDIARIPLGRDAKDGYTIVDAEDAWVDKYYWHLDRNGYPIANPRPYKRGMSNLYLHRLLLDAEPMAIGDHIDRDILNNRKSNLRIVSSGQSSKNRRGQRNKTSKYKGVSLVNKLKGKPWQWAVYDRSLPKGFIYGYVATEHEAALQYNQMASKYHGEYAVLNDVEGA